MATVTREREALIEWLTDAVARLPERHELGDIRDAIAVALASAPPAAPPEAETMPTIQVGDVVRVADSVAVIGSANAASFWGRQVLDAIYRDPLWRRPTKGDE